MFIVIMAFSYLHMFHINTHHPMPLKLLFVQCHNSREADSMLIHKTIEHFPQESQPVFRNTHPQQEGEFRIPVADVAVLAIGHINQCHDHLTKAHEGAIDTAGLLKEK